MFRLGTFGTLTFGQAPKVRGVRVEDELRVVYTTKQLRIAHLKARPRSVDAEQLRIVYPKKQLRVVKSAK